MNATAWGYAVGSAFVGFLIFLGLLSLIPRLRQRFVLRNVLAWIVSALLVGYLTANGDGSAMTEMVALLLSATLAGLRYWYVIRKHNPNASATHQ